MIVLCQAACAEGVLQALFFDKEGRKRWSLSLCLYERMTNVSSLVRTSKLDFWKIGLS